MGFIWSVKRLFLLVLLLSACVGKGNYAPVYEAGSHRNTGKNTHFVSRGETLFSIAWRYGIDFRKLARTNNIKSPYTIYPGQTLSLSKATTTTARPSKNVSRGGIKSTDSVMNRTAKPSSRKAPKATQSKSNSDFRIDRNRYPFTWKWPLRGKILRGFTTFGTAHKGVDIQGKIGNPVLAANSGKVVYAGSGLVGYGNLLILRHDDRYLSAYGHNSRLLVKEGEVVKVGQKIAEVGDSGTNEAKLHFEVRLDGKPINPTKLLPR